MPTVHYQATADTAALEKGMAKLAGEVDKLNSKLAGMKAAGKDAGDTTASAFEKATASLGGIVTTVLGIGSGLMAINTAMRLIRDSYDEMLKRQQGAATVNDQWAAAMQRAAANLPSNLFATGSEQGDRRALETFIRTTATQRGVMPLDLLNVMRDPLSATRGLTPQAVLGATEVSADFMRRFGGNVSPEEIGAYQGKLMDAMRAYGVQDPRGMAGYLLGVGKISRQVTPAQQVESMIGPALSAETFGFTKEQALELTTATGLLAGDVEGKISSAQSIRMMRALMTEEMIPYKRGKDVLWRQTKQGGMAGWNELAAAYRAAPPEMKRLMLGKIPGRGTPEQAAQIAMMAESPEAMKVMADVRQAIGPLDLGWGNEQYQQFMALQPGDMRELARGVGMTGAAAAQNQQIGNTIEAMKQRARDAVTGQYKAINLPGWDWPTRKLGLGDLEVDLASATTPGEVLRAERNALTRLRRGLTDYNPNYIGRQQENPLPGRENEVGILDAMLSQLKQQTAEMISEPASGRNAGTE